MKKLNIHPAIYYFITIIYLEIIAKITITNQFFNDGLIYMIIFTIPTVILLTLITKLFNPKTNKIISIILLLIITLYFGTQYVYATLFSVPFSFSSIGMADQALDFINIIKDTLIKYWYYILAIIIPFILFIIFNKKIDFNRYHKHSIISLIIMFIISYLSTFLLLIPNSNNDESAKKLYYNTDAPSAIINKFGVLTYTKIDIKRNIFGYESELIIVNPSNTNKDKKDEEDIVLGDNKLDIDFSSLETDNKEIQTLNNYMNKSEATNQNQYTGMFKGKNLIFILAEGFNEIAVDEDRTPTLYKMVNNGFVFNNFYSPVFLSTTGGEFQATTGLIPTQEILSLWKKEQPTISYALGNALGNIGYRAQSYHDWTYTYYKRNITMETLGFSNYTGCGNGLEERMDCGWLPFDSEMINVTTEDYLNKEGNFVTYYVTVSGHSPYNSGDNIAKKHYDTVESLEYSSSVKYYLSSQVELDKMLETLITKLEEAGELEDTVIALVGDHYPYTLSTDEMNEVSDYEKDGTIEVNRSNFILWNSEMEEPIIIDKVGGQIDVLPTLLNLFGVEYDSRLIVGKDILSNSDGLAIFSNRSWVSDYGAYNSSTRKFTLKEGKELDDINEYVKSMNTRVANAFSISKMIIDNDYYTYVLGSE